MSRWLAFLFVVFVGGFIKAKMGHHASADAAPAPADNAASVRASMQAEVADMKRRLPIPLSPHVRIEHVEFINDTAVMVAVQDGIFEPTDDAKEAFTRAVKQDYCRGSMRSAADAKIAIEVDLKTPSRTLDDPFGKTWVATFAPQQCV